MPEKIDLRFDRQRLTYEYIILRAGDCNFSQKLRNRKHISGLYSEFKLGKNRRIVLKQPSVYNYTI